ncbi:MAG: PAS domain-containing protein [Bdellovibrionales bacterium]|nr:PAS domain-containing protein [Bdellovibrionales bacterium]
MSFTLTKTIRGRQFLLALFIAVGMYFIANFLSLSVFANRHWDHPPFHSSIEIIGSMIALVVAGLLVTQEKIKSGTSFNLVIAGALLGMGILDAFHAFVNVGNTFVWLHSVATLWGGVLFFLVWFKDLLPKKIWGYWLWFVGVLSIGFGVGSLVFPEFSLTMVYEGHFTFGARFLNFTGGVLLLLSAIKMVLTYYASGKFDDILFFLHTTLFGVSAIMFQQSELWDFSWWAWHFIKLSAYGLALWFLGYTLVETTHRLKESEDRQKLVLAGIGVGVWDWIDIRSEELFLSDRVYQLLGYEANELVPTRRSFEKIVHPDDFKKAFDLFHLHIFEKEDFDLEMRLKNKNQEYIWFRVTGKADFDENMKATRIVGSMENIHKRRLLKKEQEKLVNIIQSSSDYICRFNSNFEFEFLNGSFKKLLGIKNHTEIKRLTNGACISFESKSLFEKEIIDKLKSQGIWQGEFGLIDKNENQVPTLAVFLAHKNEDNSISGFSGIFRNIKELKQYQSELEQFIYVASHDLRSPLVSIAGYVSFLMESIDDFNETQSNFIQRININLRYMSSLLNDLLELSRAKRVELHLQYVKLDQTVNKLIQSIENQIQENEADIKLTPMPVVMCDEGKISQVLINLITNAMKYRKPNVPPKIEIMARDLNGSCEVIVKDNGIGIAPEYHEKVFGLFERISHDDKKGTGLGLHIAKTLIEKHHGKIWVNSEEGQGSEFHFTIPKS